MSQTIEVRVNDYIGTSGDANLLTRIPSINDIAEKAIFDMMKSLPSELVESHITITENAGLDSVHALDDVDAHVYSVYIGNIPAQYMPPGLFNKSKDTGNYEVTALDPIYTINRNAGTGAQIEIQPDSTDFDFYQVVPTTTTVATDVLGASTFIFVPLVAHEAIILDICIKGLQAKLSDLAQDEEDPEMFQVLTAQIQQLQTSYQFELAKILGPPKEAK